MACCLIGYGFIREEYLQKIKNKKKVLKSKKPIVKKTTQETKIDHQEEIKKKTKKLINDVIVTFLISKNHFTQTSSAIINNNIDDTGYGFSIKPRFNINFLPKNYFLITEFEYIDYSQRIKKNFFIGIDKIFIHNKNIHYYFSTAIGVSQLSWTKDPLGNSTQKVTTDNTTIYALGFGVNYAIYNNTFINFHINFFTKTIKKRGN